MIIENLKSQFIKNTGLYFPYNMTFVGIYQNSAVFKGTLFIAALQNGKMINLSSNQNGQVLRTFWN